MNEDNKHKEKISNDYQTDNKFVYNIETNVSSALAKNTGPINGDESKNIQENGVSENDTANSMRIILPVFLENEQKHAQVERKRKIHSSPAKSMRRFSQDSACMEHQLSVSFRGFIFLHILFVLLHFRFLFSTDDVLVLCVRYEQAQRSYRTKINIDAYTTAFIICFVHLLIENQSCPVLLLTRLLLHNIQLN